MARRTAPDAMTINDGLLADTSLASPIRSARAYPGAGLFQSLRRFTGDWPRFHEAGEDLSKATAGSGNQLLAYAQAAVISAEHSGRMAGWHRLGLGRPLVIPPQP